MSDVWPPENWCAEVDPTRAFICDQPLGHDGDHSGPEMPTVTTDEPDALADAAQEGGDRG